jgi:hypothetical protein
MANTGERERAYKIDLNSGVAELPNFSDYLLEENPLHLDDTRRGDKLKYFATVMDSMGVEVMGTVYQLYLVDMSRRQFPDMPLVVSKNFKWRQNEVILDSNELRPGTHGVPFREITMKMKSREFTATLRGLGTQFQMAYLRTQKGMEEFDFMSKAVAMDLYRAIVFAKNQSYMMWQSFYSAARMRFALEARPPQTPEQGFDYAQKQFIIVNKQPQALRTVIAEASQQFTAASAGVVKGIIMTSHMASVTRVRDETNLYFCDTGPAAVDNRSTKPGLTPNTGGISVQTIQAIGGNLHDPLANSMFRDPVQTGGMVTFPEPGMGRDPKHYRSEDREIQFASWTTNSMQKHSPLKSWEHSLEFVPIGYAGAIDDGAINMDLMQAFAESLNPDSDSSQWKRTGCRAEGNEEWPHQFLRLCPVHGGSGNKQQYCAVTLFGEIHPHFIKCAYLATPFATMKARILALLTPIDREVIEAGVRLAQMLSRPPSDYKKTSTVPTDRDETGRANVNFGSAAFATVRIPYGYGTYDGMAAIARWLETHNGAGGIDAEVARAIGAFVPAFEKLVTVALELNSTHPFITVPPVDGESAFFSSCKSMMAKIVDEPLVPGARDDAIEMYHVRKYEAAGLFPTPLVAGSRFEAYLRLIQSDKPEDRLHARLMSAPPHESAIFTERFNKTAGLGLWDRIAQRLVLTQEVNLHAVRAWYTHNIAVPLGMTLVRPFEEMETESAVMLAETQVGITSVSPMDKILSVDNRGEKVYLQMRVYHASMPFDSKMFIVKPHMVAVAIRNGKGNMHVNEDDVLGPSMFNDARFNATVQAHFGNGTMLGHHSMFTLLESYNRSVENPFGRRSLPLAGRFDERDVYTIIESPRSLPLVVDTLAYDSQLFFNFVFPQIIRDRPAMLRNYNEATRAELVEFERNNRVVHQTTQLVRDAISGTWVEIQSAHPCGREVDGLADVQSGKQPVRRTHVYEKSINDK